ncbi:low molecular weight protein-tyrosine-phosphatase [Candidatus Thiodubiliella endoseptemdiera]|uniref:low molecular weight protein-tyrosine-phosphatase n=1 Tax=Candidatus Thiodubiliella endoseptemdiera TaxID=2738886 RepID=UPI0034DE351B
MFDNILMVCVGNICRSPMAEALLRDRLAQQKGVKIASAGVGALVGHSADATAQALMLDQGVDISMHKARQLNDELLSEYDLVLVMEKDHIDAVHDIAPLSRGRVHLLGKWSDFEIPDPYKQSKHEFESVLRLIQRGVNEWVNKL